MPTQINATAPVVVAATTSVTYDKWFMTQIIGKIDPDKAPLIVHLHRAGTVDGKTVLMPNGPNADISFTLDAWQEMSSTPEVAAAMDAVLHAVMIYAQKKGLL